MSVLLRKKILVVDDDPELLETLAEFLEEEGAEVSTAASGFEALRMSEASSFDVIVSDIQMPEMDGLELVRRLSKHHEDKPVILMTGFGGVDTLEEAMKRGAFDYLLKPFSMESLHASLTWALTSRYLA